MIPINSNFVRFFTVLKGRACLVLMTNFFYLMGSAQDITLNTQADVDAFDQSIVNIDGSLIIENGGSGINSISNLNALSNLESVHGLEIINTDSLLSLSGLENLNRVLGFTFGASLTIAHNKNLKNLDGLSNLILVRTGVTIWDNDSLVNLTGLSNIKEINNDLRIWGNPSLIDLGLDSLSRVNDLWINSCENLVDVGFENLEKVWELRIEFCNRIEDLGSFPSLSAPYPRVQIQNNESLISLDGIEKIEGDCPAIIIDNNKNLIDIGALQNITSVNLAGAAGYYGLYIHNCSSLQSLQGLHNIDQVGVISIRNNAIEALTGLSSLESVSIFYLFENDSVINLEGLESLKSVTGKLDVRLNNSLESLAGLDSLEILNGIRLEGNPLLSQCCNIQESVLTQNLSPSYFDGNLSGCNSIDEVWDENCGNTFARGSVFYDIDGDGFMDDEDYNAPNFEVLVSPSNNIYFTNESGEYKFFIRESIPQEVNVNVTENWEVTTDSISYNLGPSFFDEYPLDFGITAGEEFRSADVTMVLLDLPRCNSVVGAKLRYLNNGNVNEDLKIELQIDPRTELVSSSLVPDMMDGLKSVWTVSGGPFQYTDIELELILPSEQFTGEELSFIVKVYSESDESIILDQYEYKPIVRCSFDPNDKLVTPIGVYDENYTLFGEQLTYTVRFQNTGNAEAINIEIKDEIDSDLDLSTFNVIGSSFPIFTNIRDREVSFYFQDINLPDSTSNEAASHGFVTYEISPNDELAENTKVENTASIYFDFNPPIVTNTVLNTLVSMLPTSTNNEYIIDHYIYPNPTSNTVYVDDAYRVHKISIFDLNGRQINTFTDFPFDIGHYPRGVYFLKIHNGSNVHFQKIIKQ